jgi:hypothetical protein
MATQWPALWLHNTTQHEGLLMIYAIQSGDRTIALTNCKNNALRLSTENPDFKTRWATPSEAAFFRNRESAVQRRWWPVLKYRFEAALWWLFDTSFPTMHKHR